MNFAIKEQLKELLSKETLSIWDKLTEAVDSLYDVDRIPLDDSLVIEDILAVLKIKRKPNRK